jgi:hypothetical protein
MLLGLNPNNSLAKMSPLPCRERARVRVETGFSLFYPHPNLVCFVLLDKVKFFVD